MREIVVADAARHPQAEHHALEPGLFLRYPLDLRLLTGQVRVERRGVHRTAFVEEAVCRAAEAKVWHARPAADVMPAGEPLAGEIADLVLLEAVLRERLPHEFVHGTLDVLVGKSQPSGGDLAAEGRSFLNHQAVTRDVRGRKLQGGLERFPHVGNGLRRQAEHQVEVDVVEAGFAGDSHGSNDVLPIVDPADCLQQPRLRGLRRATAG